MNAQQARRLYNVAFVALALVVLLAGFRRTREWVDDTVGSHLRDRVREQMRRNEAGFETWNRILKTEGLEAATEYASKARMAPVPVRGSMLGFYEDHQSALVFFALTVFLVLSYFVVWFGLARLYGYILYGSKGEQDAPSSSGPASPSGNSGVTGGPPSVG